MKSWLWFHILKFRAQMDSIYLQKVSFDLRENRKYWHFVLPSTLPLRWNIKILQWQISQRSVGVYYILGFHAKTPVKFPYVVSLIRLDSVLNWIVIDVTANKKISTVELTDDGESFIVSTGAETAKPLNIEIQVSNSGLGSLGLLDVFWFLILPEQSDLWFLWFFAWMCPAALQLSCSAKTFLVKKPIWGKSSKVIISWNYCRLLWLN